MRAKNKILKESLDATGRVPQWDSTASLHEHLTIEVLTDIRDLLARYLDKFSTTDTEVT